MHQPIHLHHLIEIKAMMSNLIHRNVWYVIIYPCRHFKGGLTPSHYQNRLWLTIYCQCNSFRELIGFSLPLSYLYHRYFSWTNYTSVVFLYHFDYFVSMCWCADCPDDLTMRDWCHTNNILQEYRWGCLVVQVMCYTLMTSLMTSPGQTVGQIS